MVVVEVQGVKRVQNEQQPVSIRVTVQDRVDHKRCEAYRVGEQTGIGSPIDDKPDGGIIE